MYRIKYGLAKIARRGYGPARQCMICQLGLLDPTPCSQNSPPIGTGFPSCWLSSSLAHQGCSALTHAHIQLWVQHCHAVMQAIRLLGITSPGDWRHIPGTVKSCPRDIDFTSQEHWQHIPGGLALHPRDIGIKLWHQSVETSYGTTCWTLPPTPFPPVTGHASNCLMAVAISTSQSHTTKGNRREKKRLLLLASM